MPRGRPHGGARLAHSPGLVPGSHHGALGAPQLFYATARYSATGDPTVLELDLLDPMNPLVTNLLPVGAVDSYATASLGTPSQGEFGDLAVYDGGSVLVVELATNTIVSVGRSAPASLLPFAGAATTGGLLDSTAANALFALDAESQLLPTSDDRVFVADTRNHALRAIFGNPIFEPTSFVLTVAGTGVAGADDGDFATATFDSPTGLAVDCAGFLYVTERGDQGDGNRVRRLALTGFDPFGGALTGLVETAAGDGTMASAAGTGALATVAEPSAPVSSANGELYWLDAASGTLRRQDTGTLAADCPLAPGGDCSVPSAVCSLAADFPAGASFSLAISAAGDLWVLQADTTLLRRLAPEPAAGVRPAPCGGARAGGGRRLGIAPSERGKRLLDFAPSPSVPASLCRFRSASLAHPRPGPPP